MLDVNFDVIPHQGDMTDRHHARKAAARRARVEKGDAPERATRPDRGNVKLKGSVKNGAGSDIFCYTARVARHI